MNDPRSQNKWIRALVEPLAGVKTSKGCVAVGDLHGDGDFKLVLVDSKKQPCRLLLFNGLTPITEATISDGPSAIVTFISEGGSNVAVASGGAVLVYRNMKPYYRFTVPQIYLYPPEVQIWEAAAHSPQLHADKILQGIQECLRDVGISALTDHSLQFLAQSTIEAKEAYLTRVRNGTEALNLSNVRLTCLATMKRNQQRADGVEVLVLGAEMGGIYWVDTQAFTVIQNTQIKGTPDQIHTLGMFEVECRTFVLTREGDVVVLKKSGRSDLTQTILYLRSQPVGLTYSVNQLVFATKDKRMLFYSVRGKCLNEIRLDHPITDIEAFHYEARQYKGVLVAVKNEILLYAEMFLVDRIRMEEDVEWIKFGRLGREDGVLLIGTEGGGLYAKIFRRTAILGERAPTLGAPVAQSQKLNVPKRTKAFIDQSLREREDPQRLHKIYQRDLFMLKYLTNKTFAALQTGKTGLLPARDAELVDYNVDLNGFGPVFKLTVNVCATKQLAVAKRLISFGYESTEYSLQRNVIFMPEVLPVGVQLKFTTHVTCLHPENQTPGEIQVFMIRHDWKQPVFSSTVSMPVSEPDLN